MLKKLFLMHPSLSMPWVIHLVAFKTSLESTFLHYKHCKQFGHIILVWYYTFLEFFPFCHALHQGWAGKAFWFPGTGREIENHIPVLREGNGNSQIATGREGKGNLRLVIPGNPGNHIKSKIKFKIIFMPWQAIRSQSFFNQCKDDICNRFTQL